MNESILRSVAKYLGIGSDDSFFDPELVLIINANLAILHQLGVITSTTFAIEDSSTTWAELLIDDDRLEEAKMYVAIRTRLAFDPPTNSFLVNTLTETFKEYEQRMLMTLDDREAGVDQ